MAGGGALCICNAYGNDDGEDNGLATFNPKVAELGIVMIMAINSIYTYKGRIYRADNYQSNKRWQSWATARCPGFRWRGCTSSLRVKA